MQRKLFVAEVVADHLGQKLVSGFAQCQLYRALQVMLVGSYPGVLQAMFGEQFAVNHHMILRRVAAAELFQIGADQSFETRVAPVTQQAIQPGAVDQFGRGNGVQEK